MRRMYAQGMIMAMALLVVPALQGRPPAPPAGTYSSVCLHPDTGDLLGVELSFLPAVGGSHVLLQSYEGVATAPELLRLVVQGPLLSLRTDGGTEVMQLRQQGRTLQGTWRDGRTSSDGTAGERLVPATALWAGGAAAPCR